MIAMKKFASGVSLRLYVRDINKKKGEYMNLQKIKNYILEDGKEYRRNILLYLKWVSEDYENRKKVEISQIKEIFYPKLQITPKKDELLPDPWLYLEGIKTMEDWQKVIKGGYIIRHVVSTATQKCTTSAM